MPNIMAGVTQLYHASLCHGVGYCRVGRSVRGCGLGKRLVRALKHGKYFSRYLKRVFAIDGLRIMLDRICNSPSAKKRGVIFGCCNN